MTRDPSLARRVPRLVAISPAAAIAPRCELVPWAAELAALGVDAIQLRQKSVSASALLESALEICRCLPSSTALVVNGRADVAMAAEVEGVHLTSTAGPTRRWRRCFPDLLLGRSTHTLEEVLEASLGGADYVVFGPVRAPRSKRDGLPPTGFESLRTAAGLGIPVIALGGLHASDWAPIRAVGAHGLAAISLFQDPDEVRALVAEAAR